MSTKTAAGRDELSLARDAYMRGDFEHCLALCDAVESEDPGVQTEVALLRARALLTIGRSDRALEILRRIRSSDLGADEGVVLKMLTGAAYVRLRQAQHGIELLRSASGPSMEVHKTIRADVAVNLGIALFWNAEYGEALRVLESVDPEADIVHARAQLYIAWSWWKAGDIVRTARAFEAVLDRLVACKHYDRYVEAYALQGSARLCAEGPNLTLWPTVERRARRFDWSASGLVEPRFWFWIEASFVHEMLGQLAEARRCASFAEEQPPSPSHRVAAQCRLAALFGNYGERGAHEYFVAKALSGYDTLNVDDMIIHDPMLPLALAEEAVNTRPLADVEALLGAYREVVAPAMQTDFDGDRQRPVYDFVDAELKTLRGDRDGAVASLRTSFEGYMRLGFGRRAGGAAIKLVGLGVDEYRQHVVDVTRDASPHYWMKDALGRHETHADVRLTEAQADVLSLIMAGRTNKEIAAARAISFFRARNVVADLLVLFGASNRTELSRIATSRGFVPRGGSMRRSSVDAARVG
jgi:DNA-binding CsgD family transcriptional regulator/tetratricopeptide (TPR) repeat protein